MKTGYLIATIMVLSAAADGAQAQSLFENLARRAATSAGANALGRAVSGQGREQAAPSEADASAQSSRAPRPATERRSRRDDAPEAEGMQGLSEEARFEACSARYPTRGLTGDAWMERARQHSACMGPNWGDGG